MKLKILLTIFIALGFLKNNAQFNNNYTTVLDAMGGPNTIECDGSGGVVSGWSGTIAGNSVIVVFQVDATGSILFSKKYYESGFFLDLKAICKSNNGSGDYLLVANYESATTSGVLVYRIDNFGSVKWSHKYYGMNINQTNVPNAHSIKPSIIIDEYIIVGTMHTTNGGTLYKDAMAFKIDGSVGAQGTKKWDYTYRLSHTMGWNVENVQWGNITYSITGGFLLSYDATITLPINNPPIPGAPTKGSAIIVFGISELGLVNIAPNSFFTSGFFHPIGGGDKFPDIYTESTNNNYFYYLSFNTPNKCNASDGTSVGVIKMDPSLNIIWSSCYNDNFNLGVSMVPAKIMNGFQGDISVSLSHNYGGIRCGLLSLDAVFGVPNSIVLSNDSWFNFHCSAIRDNVSSCYHLVNSYTNGFLGNWCNITNFTSALQTNCKDTETPIAVSTNVIQENYIYVKFVLLDDDLSNLKDYSMIVQTVDCSIPTHTP